MHQFLQVSLNLFPKLRVWEKIWPFHAMQQTIFLRKASTEVVYLVLFSIQKRNSLAKRATVVVTLVNRLTIGYAERQWIARRRWVPLSVPHVLPNFFGSVLKTKGVLPLLLMLSGGKISAASRGVLRFSLRPLVLKINWKISAKMGAFRVLFPSDRCLNIFKSS